MNKQIEALKMAIEAMERAEEVDWELNSLHVLNILQAIQACKKALAEAALNEMQENAEELGLAYCKHGSDSACKECYMEQAEKQEPVGVVYAMQDGYVGQMVVKGIPHGTKLYIQEKNT